MTHCAIILPELLTVPKELVADLQVPALENMLSRGKSIKTQERCVEQSLMRHFGYVMPDPVSLPAAHILWAADFSQPAPEFCVCADPVHMLADIDHARLMDASSLKLNQAECQHYIGNLNKVFAADGLEFVIGTADRWYLTGQDASMLKALPVKTLVGRNVASFLPEGEASAHWRTLSTEVQMLLFSDPMNQTRESQDQLTLNALWLWGGASYQKAVNNTLDFCYSDDAFCQGLASLNRIGSEALSELRFDSIKGDQVLLMDGRGMDAIIYANYTSWRSWIVSLEEKLFKPLWSALKSGQIEKVTLNVGNGREYLIVSSRYPAFWRRRKPIQSHVTVNTLEPA